MNIEFANGSLANIIYTSMDLNLSKRECKGIYQWECCELKTL